MTDRGSVSVVMVAVVACGMMLSVGLVGVGQLLGARGTAVNAADAAALAAAPVTFRDFGSVRSPSDEARQYAQANGARLERCLCPLDGTYAARTVIVDVTVTVDLLGLYRADIGARSAAEFRPMALLVGQ